MAKPAVFTWPSVTASTAFVAATQTIQMQNTVAVPQDMAAAGNLILNGSYVSNGIANIAAGPQLISITSGNNLSGLNFTLTGTQNGVPISEILAGPNNNTVFSVNAYSTITNIAVSGAGISIKVGAVGPLMLKSSPSVPLGVSRQVSLTSAANQSGTNFTITGLLNNVVVSETRLGPNNNTVSTTQMYDYVTSVTANLDVAAVSVGLGLLGYTPWWLYNYQATVVGFTVQVDVNATVINYTFQTTLDDVQDPTFVPTVAAGAGKNVFEPIAAMSTATPATTSLFTPYSNVLRYSRIAVIAGGGTTAAGALKATFVQQGIT